MMPQRWPHGSTPERNARAIANGARTVPAGQPLDREIAKLAPAIDWSAWLRNTERKRRLLSRTLDRLHNPFWAKYFLTATASSFRLDGHLVSPIDLNSALAHGSAGKSFRSRQQQRVRNHVAILRHLEKRLERGDVLTSNDVVRWYTSIASGLSTTRLDEAATARLDGVVRQINSPHLRLSPAVQGIARLHRQLLVEPVVPSFNGILSRLLLRYHLGRCGLPPVMFDPERDGAVLFDEAQLLPRLLDRIDETYGLMLAKTN